MPIPEDTLRAAIDRIIPADDFPGAWDAGAGEYILRLLTGELQLSQIVESGLKGLESEALHCFARSFISLSPGEQDEVLTRISTGDVRTTWNTSPRQFFDTLLNLTNEGYYSDPGSGGNRNEIGWRMIGYETRVPARGAAHGRENVL